MRRADARLQHPERSLDAFIHVGVAYVQAHIQIHVSEFKKGQQAFGARKAVRSVFEQQLHAALLGKQLQILQGGESGVDFALIELLAADAQVLQGKIEASNVGTAESAIRVVSIMRQFEMLQKAVGVCSDMSKKSIEEVARVEDSVDRASAACVQPMHALIRANALACFE